MNNRINGKETKANVESVVIHFRYDHQDHMKPVEFMLEILPYETIDLVRKSMSS